MSRRGGRRSDSSHEQLVPSFQSGRGGGRGRGRGRGYASAIRFPPRPLGTVGKKCLVRANHFLVEVEDKDFHHYDEWIYRKKVSPAVGRMVAPCPVWPLRYTEKKEGCFRTRKERCIGTPRDVFLVQMLTKPKNTSDPGNGDKTDSQSPLSEFKRCNPVRTTATAHLPRMEVLSSALAVGCVCGDIDREGTCEELFMQTLKRYCLLKGWNHLFNS